MADEYQHFGQAKDHIWGADEVGADYGEVQRVSKAHGAQEKLLKNRVGITVGKTVYDKVKRIDVTVLLRKTKKVPEPGTVVSYDYAGVSKWQIAGTPTLDQENEDYQTLRYQLERYEGMAL